MTCDCKQKIDANLKQKGVAVWGTIPLTGGPSIALVPLVRLDNHSLETGRGKPKMIAATFCPWCGERYTT